MSAHIERARLLIQQHRYEEAEREAGQALAEDPNDPLAHTLLAVCLVEREQFEEGTQHAERAVAIVPDNDYVHHVLARVWQRRNYSDRAAASAKEAIRLDPHGAANHTLLGEIRLGQKKWGEALAAADAALALDPEETDALNVRATALRGLGQKGSATEDLRTALQVDPDDPDTHANLGWNYLEQGNRKKAEEHFREALRLEPDNQWARLGIIETIKASNPLYRGILNYFLWMAKKTAGAQWIIILAAYFGYLFLSGLADKNPGLRPIVAPILVAYIVFVICSWFAQPLSNLALRLHPFGKLALSREQRNSATIVGIALLASLVCWIVFLFVSSDFTWNLAAAASILTVSICMTTLVPSARGRKYMTYFTVGVAAMAVMCAVPIPVHETVVGRLAAPVAHVYVGLLKFSLRYFAWTMLVAVILVNVFSSMQWKDVKAERE